MGLFDFLTQEIAIDLGTANTIIIHNDKVVVDEPSIVAVDMVGEPAFHALPISITIEPVSDSIFASGCAKDWNHVT